MGNFVGNCVVIPSEERKGQNEPASSAGGRGVDAEMSAPDDVATKNATADAHGPPTSVKMVLANALYAMEFHKHLALTDRSENYEFFQSVSQFTRDAATHKHVVMEAARKVYNLYVAETAPLKVALEDEMRQSIKSAIDQGTANKQTFDRAQQHVLALMEEESLQTFLASDSYVNLTKRVEAGETQPVMQEDPDDVRESMSKEFIEFLGDPGPKEVLSSQSGIDWFRRYLVIEFAEEGIDLWTAVRDGLERHRSNGQQQGRGDETLQEGGEGNATESERQGDDTRAGSDDVVAAAGEDAAGDDTRRYDIRANGRDIFERFLKSGCGAECNLPGTVVRRVASTLENDDSTADDIARAFELVELEIFKLLAYDPFLRFKRSGMFTKYRMQARLASEHASLERGASKVNSKEALETLTPEE